MLFNSLNFIIFLAAVVVTNYIPWSEDRGYEPLTGVMQVVEGEKAANVLIPASDEPTIEERKLVYLQKFIDDCKANNIRLVMCYSPYYGQCIPKSIRMIEEMTAKNNVQFLNYGDGECFQKSECFQDAGHLNDNLATEFSKEIVSVLKVLN